MITVIKNVNVYAPEKLGIKDIVIVSDKIEGIYDNVNVPNDFVNISIIDGKGKILFPGFLDSHVHIIGGGGEGGFKTRTPEISVISLVESGITTVVGCIGTDGVCRNMRALIAKAKGLEPLAQIIVEQIENKPILEIAQEYVNIENIFNMWIVSVLSFITYYLINWGLHSIAGNPIGIIYVFGKLPWIILYSMVVITIIYLILIRKVVRHHKDRYFR